MRRAVRVLLTRFPSMEDDAGQANKDSQPLTTKIRKVSDYMRTVYVLS